MAVDRDTLRRISSSSKSETVLPSSTLPTRFVAPVKLRSASPREVFPPPPCETKATLRIEAVAYSFIAGETSSGGWLLSDSKGGGGACQRFSPRAWLPSHTASARPPQCVSGGV